MAKDIKSTLNVTNPTTCNENTIIDLRIMIGKEQELSKMYTKRLLNTMIDVAMGEDNDEGMD